jgi:hypothetical protein
LKAANGFVWRNDFAAYSATMERAPEANTGSRSRAWIERSEWAVAIVLSMVTLILFVVRATHAGSLWRDEADSVQSAQLPVGAMFHAIQFSSFPIFFPLLVRAYATLFGASDISVRCFGLAIGVFLLAIAWLSIRRVTSSVPLLLLVMIGLNTNFLIAGMSLRGYGVGSLVVLLAFLCTIKFLLNPNVRTFIALAAADLLGVHCLFWNVPLVSAMILGASTVLLLRRERKWISLLAAFFVVWAVSQLPYLLQFRSSVAGWEKIIQLPVSFDLVWHYFFVAWGDISPATSTAWLVVIAIALIFGLGIALDKRGLRLFGILVILLSILASCAMAMLIQRSPEQRFFLALTILVAASADLLWVNFSDWLRIARIILVMGATAKLPFVVWGYIGQAESNGETVAKLLQERAAPGDLIVVNPWTYGITFNWYYHGVARWVTVPQIEDHRIHRYDLVLPRMEAVSPLADIEREIANMLQSGNRVWFAGQLEVPASSETPLQVAPAPDPQVGWSGIAYRKAWSQEIGLFLSQHVQKGGPVDARTGEAISERENMSLYFLDGWKD